jgi:hypothetical protein
MSHDLQLMTELLYFRLAQRIKGFGKVTIP